MDPDTLGPIVFFGVVGFLLLGIVLWLIVVAATARAIARTIIAPVRTMPVDPSDLPQYVIPFTAQAVEELTAAGFSIRRHLAVVPEAGTARPRHLVELVDAAAEIRVVLEVPRDPARPETPFVDFRSVNEAGGDIITTSRTPDQVIAPAPSASTEACPGESLAAILTRHRQRLAAQQRRGHRIVPSAPDDALERDRRLGRDALTESERKGILRRQPDGTFVVPFRKALGIATRALDENKKRRRSAPKAFFAVVIEPPPTSAYVAHDVACLEDRLHAPSPPAGALRRVMTAVLTMALFYLALGLQVAADVALAFTAVVLVHEAGHLLAMSLFGVKDTRVLFLPFVGAAAMGREPENLAPWKQTVISLAGPIPGIFLSLLFIVFGPRDNALLEQTAKIALGLNLINLVPVAPLDGGRIIEHLLGNRFHGILAGFRALSGLALVAAGLALGFGTFFAVLGGFLLMQTPREFAVARSLRTLRTTLTPDLPESSRLAAIAAHLRTGRWTRVQPQVRHALALQLSSTLQRPDAGVGALVLALLGFSAPVWMAFGLRAVARAIGP